MNNQTSINFTHFLLVLCLLVLLGGFGLILTLLIMQSPAKTGFSVPQHAQLVSPAPVSTSSPVMAISQPQSESPPAVVKQPPPINPMEWQQLVEQQQQQIVQQHQHKENAVPVSPVMSAFTLPPVQKQGANASLSLPAQSASEPSVRDNRDHISGSGQISGDNSEPPQSDYLNPEWAKSSRVANMDSFAGQSLANQKGYLSPNQMQSLEDRYNPHSDNRPVFGLNLSSTDKLSGGSISSGNAAAISRVEQSKILIPNLPRDNLVRPYDRSVNYQEYSNRAFTSNPALAVSNELELKKIKLAQQQLADYTQIEKAKIDLQRTKVYLQQQHPQQYQQHRQLPQNNGSIYNYRPY